MLLALTPAAQAADIEAVPPEPMGWSWYVSVFGGWSHAKDEHLLLEDTCCSITGYLDADIDLDDGFMVGAAVGAQINEWLRGEVEVSGHFHDAGGDVFSYVHQAGSTTTTNTYNLDGDEKALFVLANLWLDLPIGGMFRPYIGGGVGAGHLDVDIDFESGGGNHYTIIDDSDWGFAWQVGAGVAFDLSESIAIDVGYRYKRINNADLEVDEDVEDWFSDDVTPDEIEKDYKSHNVLVGLRIMF
jgi:opacity protein-like surface antigen